MIRVEFLLLILVVVVDVIVADNVVVVVNLLLTRSYDGRRAGRLTKFQRASSVSQSIS
jgi:hypothetical protein